MSTYHTKAACLIEHEAGMTVWFWNATYMLCVHDTLLWHFLRMVISKSACQLVTSVILAFCHPSDVYICEINSFVRDIIQEKIQTMKSFQ